MKSVLKIIGSILFYGILVLAVVLAGMFAFSTDERKSILGYRFYEVLSGSMRPTIDIGELVVIKMTDPAGVQVGDIVTKAVSEDGSTTLTHRVIQKYQDENGRLMVVTQGDNNTSPDSAIPADALIGTLVFHVPLVGYAVGFVKGNLVYVGFAVLSLIALSIVLRRIFRKERSDEAGDPEILEQQALALIEQAEVLLSQAQAIRAATIKTQTEGFDSQEIYGTGKEGERSKRPVMPTG